MRITVYPNREFRFSCRLPRPAESPQAKSARLRAAAKARAEIRAARNGRPLDFNTQLSQTKSRKDFGLRPIRPVARARIRQLSGVFSSENKKRQVFCTGTLPGSTDGAMVEFARLSGYAIKLLQTYVPRSVGLKAESVRYLWCWEHQKRGALHIHAVFEFPSDAIALQFQREWAGIWNTVLGACAGKAKKGVDIFARRYGGTWAGREEKWQSDAQIVEKSAARYLSKYMSKGSCYGSRFRPSRWYGASRSCRASLSEITESLSCMVQSCPKDSMSVREIRRSAKEVLALCLRGGEVRSDRSDDGWGVGLMGFLSDDVTGGSVLGILEESCKEYLIMKPISPLSKIQELRAPERIKRFLAAYYQAPVWFRCAVECNVPDYLKNRDSWYGVGIDEALDIRDVVSSELYMAGFIGSERPMPGWVIALRVPILADE